MNRILLDHLKSLSIRYTVEVFCDLSEAHILDFNCPPGYNYTVMEVRLILPEDYPASPPGVSPSSVYVPSDLLFRGNQPNDFHPNCGPSGFAWWCFESIKWDPCRDDLITFMELLRLTMTDPPT